MDNKLKFTELAQFQDKQLEAWYTLMSPKTKYLLFGGAAGGGKSYLLRWSAVGLALYYYSKYGIKGVPIGLFSEDYPTLRDRQVTKIGREFPTWLGSVKETNKDGLGFFLKPEYGSGMILLRNLDDPSKYASVEFAALLVEELTKNKYQTFEDLRNRMRFPGIEDRKFLAATNPGEIGHGWVKQLFVTPDLAHPDIEQDKFKFIQSLVSDNKYNPTDYITQLQAIRDDQKRKALLEGDWNQFQGQYFGEWRDHHVINPFIPLKEGSVFVGGLDWGRADPFAFYVTQITRVDYNGVKFYRSKVFLEAYGTEKSPAEWSSVIKEKLKGANLQIKDISWIRADTQIYAKNIDGKTLDIYNQFIQADSEWRILKPANKDRIGGWENLHKWLSLAPDGKPYLQFASNCVNAIRTIPELVHDDNKVEDVAAGEDHSGDAVRYLHMSLKWIDAGAGAVIHPQNEIVRSQAPQFIQSKQVSINLDLFGNPDADSNDLGAISRS